MTPILSGNQTLHETRGGSLWWTLIIVAALAVIGALTTNTSDQPDPTAAPEVTASSNPGPTSPSTQASTPSTRLAVEPTVELVRTSNETAEQRNAREAAAQYLSFQAFSRKGLIGQLKFDGFPAAVATYAVDHVNVNWADQATKAATTYVENMPLSQPRLVDQLVFDGFTREQAQNGVRSLDDVDWNAEAVEAARSYLETQHFSRDGLIGQLVFDGFTQAQANYAADQTF
jgi:SOS response regulatory protein OraA/RecX